MSLLQIHCFNAMMFVSSLLCYPLCFWHVSIQISPYSSLKIVSHCFIVMLVTLRITRIQICLSLSLDVLSAILRFRIKRVNKNTCHSRNLFRSCLLVSRGLPRHFFSQLFTKPIQCQHDGYDNAIGCHRMYSNEKKIKCSRTAKCIQTQPIDHILFYSLS